MLVSDFTFCMYILKFQIEQFYSEIPEEYVILN